MVPMYPYNRPEVLGWILRLEPVGFSEAPIIRDHSTLIGGIDTWYADLNFVSDAWTPP